MNNESFVAELIRSKALKTSSSFEAFLTVDRSDFVVEKYKDFAYDDKALPLIEGSTISQPTTVAIMLELLQPQANQKILDIGSGSAWTTALLSEIVGENRMVIGTEINPEVLNLGKGNLEKYNYPQAQMIPAGKNIGLLSESPFDRILVSAAASSMPTELTEQLAVGGIMVIPIQHSLFKVVRISETQIEASEFPGFSFVPLK